MLARRPLQKKFLLGKKEKQHEIKEIAIYENPERLKPVLNKLTWKILLMLHQKEMYPMEIAKKLNIHEQKVYYHMRKLVKADVIKKVREEERKGAIAKYYKANFPAFGVELPLGGTRLKNLGSSLKSKGVQQFLYPILRENLFDGKIVVGSPDPHGQF